MDQLERIFTDLESNQTHDCEEAKRKLGEYFTQIKEQWLVQGMMEYFLKTGSLRIGEVLIKVQAPHDTHIFDRLSEWLKIPTHRLPAINFFSFVVRRHPTWLYKVERHRLIKEIFKLLQTEKEIVPLMSALLCIITLLPIIPNAVPNFLEDLFAVFGYLASWNCENPIRLSGDKLVHLQLGLQMLFHRLYGMYPCNFLAYLTDFIKKDQKGAIYQHTIKPLLATVSVHPLLLTANANTETSSTRWKEMEPHDVVVECASVTLPVLHQDFNMEAAQQLPAIHEYSAPDTPILALPSNVPQLMHSMQTITQQTTSQTVSWFGTPLEMQNKRSHLNSATELKRQRNWEENNLSNKIPIWSPYNELTAATAANIGPIPLTPTPNYMLPMVTPNAANAHQLLGLTGSSPPEAAVEATPETTPMKDITKDIKIAAMTAGQTTSSVLGNPNAVRAIFASSQPSSPMRKDPHHFSFPEAEVATDFVGDDTVTARQSTYIEQEFTKRTLLTRERGFERTQEENLRSNIDQTIETQAIAATRRGNFTSLDTAGKCGGNLDMDSDVAAHTTRTEHLSANRTHTHTPTLTQQQMQSSAPTPTPTLENITRACLECNETDVVCRAGGLQIPTDCAMKMLLTGIKRRNRMVSCSYNEREKSSDFRRNAENGLINDKEAKVRRTKSCSSICLAISSSESSPTKDKSKDAFHDLPACRLQKSGKMLAIATASKTNTIATINERSNAACQTIESAAALNYDSSLFTMLCEARDLHRRYESKLMNPQQLLDQFIMSSLVPKSNYDFNFKPDQDHFQLLNLQLQYERYRREIHAERNRRLMGRNRTKRSLEMERDRLREQLNSFAANNDKLMKKNDATIKAANEREQRLNEEIIALKSRYRNEVEQNKCLKEANENLQTHLTEQLSGRKDINYELEALRGQIFNLNTELQQAQLQVDIGSQYKQELARLEAEVIIMGEIHVKCRDQLLEMENLKAREDEMQKFREIYHIELKDSKFKLDEKMSQLDAAKHKIIELQAQVVHCEKENTELKRLLRTVKNEYEERFTALTNKYENQKIILMQMEEKIASLYRPYPAQGASSPDADKTDVASSMERNSPLSTSLASSESLSTSLRSTEFRNLQQLAESNSGANNAVIAHEIGRLATGNDFDSPSASNSGAATSHEQRR